MQSLKRSLKQLANLVIRPLGEEIRSAYTPPRSPIEIYGDDLHRGDKPKFVNVGAGRFQHSAWHNLDYVTPYYKQYLGNNVHIEHDLVANQPFAIASDSLKAAYSSHVVEHIFDDNVAFMIKEVYRCLRPGGRVRIMCPDYAFYCKAYMEKQEYVFPKQTMFGDTELEYRFLETFASERLPKHPAQNLKKYTDAEIKALFQDKPMTEAFDELTQDIPRENQHQFPGHHRNWHTHEKLFGMMREAGFTTCYASAYAQSLSPYMCDVNYFDHYMPEVSLFVEGQK